MTDKKRFKWLKFMGLEETKRYFNAYGMEFGLEWWERIDTNNLISTKDKKCRL